MYRCLQYTRATINPKKLEVAIRGQPSSGIEPSSHAPRSLQRVPPRAFHQVSTENSWIINRREIN